MAVGAVADGGSDQSAVDLLRVPMPPHLLVGLRLACKPDTRPDREPVPPPGTLKLHLPAQNLNTIASRSQDVVSYGCMALCAALYITMGIFGYLLLGDAATADVLEDLVGQGGGLQLDVSIARCDRSARQVSCLRRSTCWRSELSSRE